MTPRPRDDRGSITPLIVGFALIVALLVAVVVDASAAYLRRQGLARAIVDALELRAAQQSYRRVYLTTGFRQPEAWALYDRNGYTRLFDASIDPEAYFHLRFGKDLADPSRTSTLADLWAPLPEAALPR